MPETIRSRGGGGEGKHPPKGREGLLGILGGDYSIIRKAIQAETDEKTNLRRSAINLKPRIRPLNPLPQASGPRCFLSLSTFLSLVGSVSLSSSSSSSSSSPSFLSSHLLILIPLTIHSFILYSQLPHSNPLFVHHGCVHRGYIVSPALTLFPPTTEPLFASRVLLTDWVYCLSHVTPSLLFLGRVHSSL